jgi:RNA polymerase sigma-70 factor (ECF subfamily)
MLEAADDRALVEACLGGAPDAFDLLVQRHQREVYRLCYRFVGTHEDASDLAQDAFVRAYRGLAGFKGRSAFRTWLYRVAVNVCLNHVARTRPELSAIDEVDVADESVERADSRLLRAERAAEVRAAIATLPPKQRATLILRLYHDLSHEEIAGILGNSVGATKANLFHALARLKTVLQRST